MSQNDRFDATWIANRFRYRKTLKGTRMCVDPVTGYMRPVGRDGFTAEERAIFIERLRLCSNTAQICRSIPIDIQSFYDAIAVDTKFRQEVNLAYKIPNRAMQLNNGLEEIRHVEKKTVVNELVKAMEKYK